MAIFVGQFCQTRNNTIKSHIITRGKAFEVFEPILGFFLKELQKMSKPGMIDKLPFMFTTRLATKMREDVKVTYIYAVGIIDMIFSAFESVTSGLCRLLTNYPPGVAYLWKNNPKIIDILNEVQVCLAYLFQMEVHNPTAREDPPLKDVTSQAEEYRDETEVFIHVGLMPVLEGVSTSLEKVLHGLRCVDDTSRGTPQEAQQHQEKQIESLKLIVDIVGLVLKECKAGKGHKQVVMGMCL
jgi:hypothetical protein